VSGLRGSRFFNGMEQLHYHLGKDNNRKSLNQPNRLVWTWSS